MPQFLARYDANNQIVYEITWLDGGTIVALVTYCRNEARKHYQNLLVNNA